MIAFIGGPQEESSAAERLEGYRSALGAHGLAADEGLVRIADWEQINGGFEATMDLLGKERGRVKGPRGKAKLEGREGSTLDS